MRIWPFLSSGPLIQAIQAIALPFPPGTKPGDHSLTVSQTHDFYKQQS